MLMLPGGGKTLSTPFAPNPVLLPRVAQSGFMVEVVEGGGGDGVPFDTGGKIGLDMTRFPFAAAGCFNVRDDTIN